MFPEAYKTTPIEVMRRGLWVKSARNVSKKRVVSLIPQRVSIGGE